MRLKVATCQFPISPDVRKNLGYVARQLGAARDRDADVAHFPEGSLSGYAGIDFASFRASIGICCGNALWKCSTSRASIASGSSSGRRTG